ncbi:hypothetical protein V1512DRAFT_251724 [Lipomyces arxii]|uniref:uncharacterized protein n=1 Tax=Lipomyces arxii TaxID=56418 RepID=UPI0034CECDCD
MNRCILKVTDGLIHKQALCYSKTLRTISIQRQSRPEYLINQSCITRHYTTGRDAVTSSELPSTEFSEGSTSKEVSAQEKHSYLKRDKSRYVTKSVYIVPEDLMKSVTSSGSAHLFKISLLSGANLGYDTGSNEIEIEGNESQTNRATELLDMLINSRGWEAPLIPEVQSYEKRVKITVPVEKELDKIVAGQQAQNIRRVGFLTRTHSKWSVAPKTVTYTIKGRPKDVEEARIMFNHLIENAEAARERRNSWKRRKQNL